MNDFGIRDLSHDSVCGRIDQLHAVAGRIGLNNEVRPVCALSETARTPGTRRRLRRRKKAIV
jgi:hypothetical protein